jgi:hypothetical protein
MRSTAQTRLAISSRSRTTFSIGGGRIAVGVVGDQGAANVPSALNLRQVEHRPALPQRVRLRPAARTSVRSPNTSVTTRPSMRQSEFTASSRGIRHQSFDEQSANSMSKSLATSVVAAVTSVNSTWRSSNCQ